MYVCMYEFVISAIGENASWVMCQYWLGLPNAHLMYKVDIANPNNLAQ